MKVKITADSTCDLSPELIRKYNITIIPLSIIREGRSYLDTVEIRPKDIFDYFDKTGTICSTTAVNVADYIDQFRKAKEGYDAIVHFCISSSMSACYQNACIAAEDVGNVYPIDSQNLSTGIGQLVLDASLLASAGMDAPEIAAEINRRKEKLDVSFVLDTLLYLWKGGRCNAVAAFGANLLNLKPCIEVRAGKMGVGKKYRGSLKKCLVSYVEDRLKGADDIDYRRIFITDSGISRDLYQTVLKTVQKCGPFQEIINTQAGCTISSHCGPNCLGILYYHK